MTEEKRTAEQSEAVAAHREGNSDSIITTIGHYANRKSSAGSTISLKLTGPQESDNDDEIANIPIGVISVDLTRIPSSVFDLGALCSKGSRAKKPHHISLPARRTQRRSSEGTLFFCGVSTTPKGAKNVPPTPSTAKGKQAKPSADPAQSAVVSSAPPDTGEKEVG